MKCIYWTLTLLKIKCVELDSFLYLHESSILSRKLTQRVQLSKRTWIGVWDTTTSWIALMDNMDNIDNNIPLPYPDTFHSKENCCSSQTPAVISLTITAYHQEHSLPFRGMNPPIVPALLVKNCQESLFLKKFSCLHVSYAKQITYLSAIKTTWTVMVKSRNHRNFSRLAVG